MKNSEIIGVQARLYDLQTKLTVCVYVLQPGNVFDEDDINGLNCVLCDVIDDLETLNEELTGSRKPTDLSRLPTLPEISEMSTVVKFPGNGDGEKKLQLEQERA